jgi:hypothetical protein
VRRLYVAGDSEHVDQHQTEQGGAGGDFCEPQAERVEQRFDGSECERGTLGLRQEREGIGLGEKTQITGGGAYGGLRLLLDDG